MNRRASLFYPTLDGGLRLTLQHFRTLNMGPTSSACAFFLTPQAAVTIIIRIDSAGAVVASDYDGSLAAAVSQVSGLAIADVLADIEALLGIEGREIAAVDPYA